MTYYNDNELFIPAALILLVGFVIGWGCGTNWTDHKFKRQAIINRAAHWIIVDDTGKVEFKWNSTLDK
jgi:hypothetical protein